MISDFITMPGIKVIHEVNFETLLKLWPDKVADFGDAIVATVAKSQKAARIVTFDEKFVRALTSVGLKAASL